MILFAVEFVGVFKVLRMCISSGGYAQVILLTLAILPSVVHALYRVFNPLNRITFAEGVVNTTAQVVILIVTILKLATD